MMRIRGSISLAITCVVAAACASTRPLPSSYEAILADAENGRLDVCRDTRLFALRHSGAGEGGDSPIQALREAIRFRLGQLDADVSEPSSAARRIRLVGLKDTLDAVAAAPDRKAWNDAIHRAERQVNAWLRQAAEWRGEEPETLVMRHAVWQEARKTIETLWNSQSTLTAGTLDCLHAPHAHSAREAAVAAAAETFFDVNWPRPNQPPGASLDVVRLVMSMNDQERAGSCTRWRNAMNKGASSPGLTFATTITACERPMPASENSYVDELEVNVSHVSGWRSTFRSRSIADDLLKRAMLDQFIRMSSATLRRHYATGADSPSSGRVSALIGVTDRENTAWLRPLLQTRDWFDDTVDGAGAQRYAWLIVQHADHDRALQKEVLQRMEKYVGTSRIGASDYAMLWDRVAVSEGRPQRYATQVECVAGQWRPKIGVENAPLLDQRRNAAGLSPWSIYQARIAAVGGSCD